jgi:FkbM family methyltransferase
MDIKELKYLNLIKKYFSSEPNIIDIGGFKGKWTNSVLEILPNSKISIFEPNSENFNHLEQIFSSSSNIKLFNFGVGDKSDKQKYFDIKSHDGIREMSGFIKRELYNNHEFEELEIDIVNLDSLDISNDKIDFIKIDVEGYEYNVLSGMKNMLSNSNVSFIQFEYGGTYLDAKLKLNDIISLLNDFGYKVYDIGEYDEFIHLSEFIDDYQYNNFIATKLNLNKNNKNMEYKFDHRDKLPEFLTNLGLVNKGVELGTFKGGYSRKIVSNWPGKLYMVDVWRPLSIEEYDDASNHQNHIDAYSEAMSEIKGYEDRAFMLRMKGIYASELFEDNSLDFVYIDANHTYEGVKEDIKYWYPKVKPGGLLLGHDYIPNDMYNDDRKDLPIYLYANNNPDEVNYAGMFGVNPAVNEFAEENNYVVNQTDEWLGTWWIKKV